MHYWTLVCGNAGARHDHSSPKTCFPPAMSTPRPCRPPRLLLLLLLLVHWPPRPCEVVCAPFLFFGRVVRTRRAKGSCVALVHLRRGTSFLSAPHRAGGLARLPLFTQKGMAHAASGVCVPRPCILLHPTPYSRAVFLSFTRGGGEGYDLPRAAWQPTRGAPRGR